MNSHNRRGAKGNIFDELCKGGKSDFYESIRVFNLCLSNNNHAYYAQELFVQQGGVSYNLHIL